MWDTIQTWQTGNVITTLEKVNHEKVLILLSLLIDVLDKRNENA
jgi:hypothetical protein